MNELIFQDFFFLLAVLIFLIQSSQRCRDLESILEDLGHVVGHSLDEMPNCCRAQSHTTDICQVANNKKMFGLVQETSKAKTEYANYTHRAEACI